MKLGPQLIQLLSKTYEPDSLINMKFKSYDIAFKTNSAGEATLLFLGKLDTNEQIKGLRYVRTLVKDQEGRILKDHWELKGKAT